ncbi:MAG: methyltransferase domain-containing protein [Bryobacteraceae bacterium]
MRRDQVLRGIEVRSGDFVIDIGSGHRPFWRADLVIEKYPFDHGLHRNQPMRFPGVPVIKADAHAMPVPDGGCDLIFASHIIEHLTDPQCFIAEVKRCSRRVYLEFPSRYRELMHAWSFHAWLVEARGTVLRFYRNDLPQLFGPLFHAEHDAALGAWSEARHEYLNTSIYCLSEELECEFPSETLTELVLRDSLRGDSKLNFADVIHRPAYSLRETLAFAAQSLLSSGLYTKLSQPREKPTSPAPLPEAVLARLMCLRCRSTALRRTGNEITCSCGARYSQDRGVFDFDPQN